MAPPGLGNMPASSTSKVSTNQGSLRAGLGVNYAKGGQSGFEVGTQGNAVSMTLRDPQGQRRASLEVDGPVKPA